MLYPGLIGWVLVSEGELDDLTAGSISNVTWDGPSAGFPSAAAKVITKRLGGTVSKIVPAKANQTLSGVL